MKWEKNISITSLNRFNYVLVLNQLEELLSNIKTEVTTLTLTLVHLTPVSGRLAKKKPDIIPAVHPRTNRRAEMRLQGKATTCKQKWVRSMQQRRLLDSLHLYYQRKALLLRWLFSIASFTKQGFWNGIVEGGKNYFKWK